MAQTRHESDDKQTKQNHAKADPKADDTNPKIDPKDESNRIKDPKDWTTGGEPMTGAQASYLKTLAEQAKDDEAFDPDLDKAEASQRIDALRKATGKDAQ